MNLKMRRLTWFMRKHSEGEAHWDDEERPWNPFLLSDVRRDGMPFVFIIHHHSIVYQSGNGRRAVAICVLIISLAHMKHWRTKHSSIQDVCLFGSFNNLPHCCRFWGDIFDYWWFGTKRFSRFCVLISSSAPLCKWRFATRHWGGGFEHL